MAGEGEEIMPETYKLVQDRDGGSWMYRMSGATLQRKRPEATICWLHVSGMDFLTMTPAELRHVADVLEGGGLELGVTGHFVDFINKETTP